MSIEELEVELAEAEDELALCLWDPELIQLMTEKCEELAIEVSIMRFG
jgi:hypothetical protein